jgi:dipeptidyl aminopeptidase/acylaminoacyl peptidase
LPLVFLLLLYAGADAQHRIHVTEVTATAPVRLVNPLIIDSTNLKKDKFDDKQLLETLFLPQKSDFKERFVADSSNVIFMPKAATEKELRFLTFNVNSDRYATLKISVTSPAMLELYVNSKKEASKTTREDSLKLAKDLSKEITVTPGTAVFALKYLGFADSKLDGESLKILVEAKDSAANLMSATDSRRFIRINDIMEATRVSGGNISPDGRFVLLNYSGTVEGGESSRYSELFDVKTGKRLFLDRQLSWMPVSNRLYCTAQRGEHTVLVTVDPENMSESVLAENIPKGSFRFTPDERRLIYSVKESHDERKGDLLILKSPADRQEGYLDRHFIYCFGLDDRTNRRLTYGQHTTSVQDISRDSRRLLFSTNDEELTERPFRRSSMFILDLQNLRIDTLWKNEKYVHSASFSPNGEKILITGAPEAFGGIGLDVPAGTTANSYDAQAFIMDLASRQIDAVSKKFDPSINRVSWHSDDEIYFSVTEADYENVYRYSIGKRNFTRLNLNENVINSFQPARNAPVASYVGSGHSNFGRAYVYDMKTGKSTLISDPAKDRLSEIKLGEVREFDFAASDGTTIRGRYYLPPNFDASRKYPLVVYYYGGTTPTARTLSHPYPMHVYAAMGYVVYTLQPSGTVGFGQEFSARHVNAWGKRTADDIIEGVKRFVAEHSFVNGEKIGCIGASYGGFMTMYLQTVTDMFAAAVSHAGISALASYWGEGYWGYAYSAAASANSYPWNNRELYVEQSPLYNADKIKTPILLLHGLEDTNVPPGESFQMFTALKILGKPVEFIRVKGENHGIANYKRRLEWNHSIYAWFARWLKDDDSWWNALYP